MKTFSDYLGKEFDTEELEERHGTLEFEGRMLYPVQSPYVDTETTYEATAIDEDGNTYLVTWDTLDSWDGIDESDACYWDKYRVVRT